MTFSTDMTSLEKLVKKLENEELSLEESLKIFEKGVKMISKCRDHLTRTEQKIEILTEQGTKPLKMQKEKEID